MDVSSQVVREVQGSKPTERPYVNLGSVLLLLDYLGSHPIWCPNHGGAL